MKKFVLVSYLWSYVMWGIAIITAASMRLPILLHESIFRAYLDNALSFQLVVLILISTLGTYGPMIAYIYIAKTSDHKGKFSVRISPKYIVQMIVLYLVITLLPTLTNFYPNNSFGLSVPSTVLLVIVYFIFQLLTSGTEEIGWRGFLLPYLLKSKTPWNASVHLGFIWGLWHMPIVLYIFYLQGLTLLPIVFSFIGFVAGIIASSVIHTYFYIKTENAFFSMIIHAFGNTAPLLAGFLVEDFATIGVIVQILQWIIVFLLLQKEKNLFETKPSAV